jgi:NAD-dependent deacetylase
MHTSEALRSAAHIIINATHLVALTGAGISRESNVPTFRGEDGLWKQYDAMQLATPEAFRSDPRLVWEWYSWRQGLIARCSPNPAHEVLAAWEQKGILKSVITQNVDGLHARAGSKTIYEVHGNLWSLKCTSCQYTAHIDSPAEGVPTCPSCSGVLRPDVVWFGESLNHQTLRAVYDELYITDVCLVIGTSALVQPAASFPLIVKEGGGSIIEINTEETPLSTSAAIHLQGKAGEILLHLNSLLSSV